MPLSVFQKSREEWQSVLYIVTAVSVLGGVVFLVFARGDVQDWARDADRDVSIEIEASIRDEKVTSGCQRSADNETVASVHLLSEEDVFKEMGAKEGTIVEDLFKEKGTKEDAIVC